MFPLIRKTDQIMVVVDERLKSTQNMHLVENRSLENFYLDFRNYLRNTVALKKKIRELGKVLKIVLKLIYLLYPQLHRLQ